MRGNPPNSNGLNIKTWSIPACAGEPNRFSRRPKRSGVYPRVCGGTGFTLHPDGDAWGLSPRVRGNRGQLGMFESHDRSIPACAGEPISLSGAYTLAWVYPRVCGGTVQPPCLYKILPGLSPRVRGNPRKSFERAWSIGSIPACAGEPLVDPLPKRLDEVYPRVCGGTPSALARRQHGWGLSPRVRGNPMLAPMPLQRRGSIPACAGEPVSKDEHDPFGKVYPRVCGGTRSSTRDCAFKTGLSPRVRGNPLGAGSRARLWGSIPACAGEPAIQRPTDIIRKVYPRVCGGTARRH